MWCMPVGSGHQKDKRTNCEIKAQKQKPRLHSCKRGFIVLGRAVGVRQDHYST